MWAEFVDPLAPPEPAADPLDDLIGRAIVDPTFARTLLADPAGALAPAALPSPLKRALVAIRADSLGQFARRALAIRAALDGGTRAPIRLRSGP
jgi:hypothetical protein